MMSDQSTKPSNDSTVSFADTEKILCAIREDLWKRGGPVEADKVMLLSILENIRAELQALREQMAASANAIFDSLERKL